MRTGAGSTSSKDRMKLVGDGNAQTGGSTSVAAPALRARRLGFTAHHSSPLQNRRPYYARTAGGRRRRSTARPFYGNLGHRSQAGRRLADREHGANRATRQSAGLADVRLPFLDRRGPSTFSWRAIRRSMSARRISPLSERRVCSPRGKPRPPPATSVPAIEIGSSFCKP